ncbi:hypothetical protein IQ249_24690 [Lusitaniella coriacea LEGE 07157]|uniref:Uncharacterized protein n=1 Tax=Lusitaniella coriacea LEGE 07157 TaxID=945747 RepID=A0A8J7E275_9CYAN|nr:hypothetical protein [Lusitaniella coriacea]MBE9119058.1 hypothetical protein [Lusitaniella coriacea LEGE 07157]
MIKDAAKKQKPKNESKAGRSLATSLKKSAQQEAQSVLQLRAKATAAEVVNMVESGQYLNMVWGEMEAFFTEAHTTVNADIQAVEEAFLLPPSSSSIEVEAEK